jgi:DNA-binding NarL/FixJ family response regulator
MEPKKKILIVDDHPMFREGLKSIIARNPGFEVVGETGEGKAVREMAKCLEPDLVILDIVLPDGSGIEFCRELAGCLPQVKTLIVSMHTKIDYVTGALQAGAKGFVVKDAPSEKILQALETVARGEFFLDAGIAPQVMAQLAADSESPRKMSRAAYNSLTVREQEILRYLAEGMSSKDIADRLYISPKTVDNHRTNILAKLGLRSTVELVHYAAKLGLIDLDRWNP